MIIGAMVSLQLLFLPSIVCIFRLRMGFKENAFFVHMIYGTLVETLLIEGNIRSLFSLLLLK